MSKYWIILMGYTLCCCGSSEETTVSEIPSVNQIAVPFDSSVVYRGPSAQLASITGSPFWPFSYDQIIATMESRDWQLEFDKAIRTPYGAGPRVLQFVTPNGRRVLWIPDYGWQLGQDDRIRFHQESLFWILWQAGVKVMVVGGNSGSADWRDGPEAVSPGDLVFPWSFSTGSWYRGLPGTQYESVWGNPEIRAGNISQPFMGDPFSPRLAQSFYDLATEYAGAPFRKIHHQDSVRVAIVHPASITFETDFDILHWQAVSKMISHQHPDNPPVVTIHGDAINPILARYLGIEMLYYHIVSNVAQGLPAPKDISQEKDEIIYAEDYGETALKLEMKFLEVVSLD